MDRIQYYALISLVAVAIFDPGDLLFHLKVPLFVVNWVILCLDFLLGKTVYTSSRLILYVGIFAVLLPGFSIAYYFSTNDYAPDYAGFVFLKSYLFLSILFIIYGKKIDLIKSLSMILTALSVFIIFVALSATYLPAVYEYVRGAGNEYMFLQLGMREYGDTTFHMIHYISSPILVVSIAFFTHQALGSTGTARGRNIVLCCINIIAMFLSGTRNNMLASIVVPTLVLYWDTKKTALLVLPVLVVLGLGIIEADAIRAMISVEDLSNSIKIEMMNEFFALFSNTQTLFFGQGLGASLYIPDRGYMAVTELTYFDFVRYYGLVGSSIFFYLLAYPLKMLRLKAAHQDHYIYLAYFVYLGMCMSNPLLISSTGMLILAIVLCRMFIFQNQRHINNRKFIIKSEILGKVT